MRDPDALRAFVRRDWAAASRDKERYWAEHQRQGGFAEGIRIAEGLRQQVLRARPDWPSAEEREEDLATHLRVLEVVGRVPRCAR